MSDYVLCPYPIKKYCNLEEAINWIAFKVYPIFKKYYDFINGDDTLEDTIEEWQQVESFFPNEIYSFKVEDHLNGKSSPIEQYKIRKNKEDEKKIAEYLKYKEEKTKPVKHELFLNLQKSEIKFIGLKADIIENFLLGLNEYEINEKEIAKLKEENINWEDSSINLEDRLHYIFIDFKELTKLYPPIKKTKHEVEANNGTLTIDKTTKELINTESNLYMKKKQKEISSIISHTQKPPRHCKAIQKLVNIYLEKHKFASEQEIWNWIMKKYNHKEDEDNCFEYSTYRVYWDGTEEDYEKSKGSLIQINDKNGKETTVKLNSFYPYFKNKYNK